MSTRRKCGALCQEENRPAAGVNSRYRGVGDRKDRNVGTLATKMSTVCRCAHQGVGSSLQVNSPSCA
jgi:hypothetical protein